MWMQAAAAPDLDRLRWQNRVVVVWAESTNDERLSRQEKLLQANTEGLDERDVKVFSLTGDTPEGQHFRTKLGIEHHSFALVLIGKDGSVKLRKYEPVDPRDLFRTIDRMPMRKDEMKRR